MILLLLASGCADGTPARELPEWTLHVPGRAPSPITVPSRFGDRVPEGATYRLRSEARIPPSWRGQPLTISIPYFQGLPEVWVDGTRVRRTDDDPVEVYRPQNAQAWFVPAELTDRPTVEVELRVPHTWTQAAWMLTVPRLTVGEEMDGQSRFVATFNSWTSAAGLGMMLTIAFTYLVLFLNDPKATYFWLTCYSSLGSIYLVHQLALGQLLFGVHDVSALATLLCFAVLASVHHTHVRFDLQRPLWPWNALAVVHVLLLLATTDPFVATPIHGPVTVATLGAVIVYQLITFTQLAKRRPRPSSVWVNLIAWASIAVGATFDAFPWIGLPEPLGGIRTGGVALTGFSIAMFVGLSREHLISLRRADSLNAELARGMREIEVLNAELRRQIAERSRQLSEALGRLARGRTEATTLATGDVVEERYRVASPIGAGAMGSVYRVERVEDGRTFALKVLTQAGDAEQLARFAREAQIASEVHHPNVVGIVDVGVSGSGFMYLVMELVEGPSVRDCRERFGDVSWALEVVAEVAAGLDAIHAAGVVHRDLKPANVLVASEAPLRVKISDFGISGMAGSSERPEPPEAQVSGTRSVSLTVREKSEVPASEEESVTFALASGSATVSDADARPEASLATGQLTRTGWLMGTPVYMAPEAVGNARRVRASSDLFSLGVMAFELLTGDRPFTLPPSLAHVRGQPLEEAPDFASRCRGLDREVARVLQRCLSFQAHERPSASEVARAIRSADGRVRASQ